MGTQTAAAMEAEAKTRVENLTPEDVEREVRAGALLVDIREPEERQGGAIAGSTHAASGMLESYADPTSPYRRPEFDRERRIVLYCASGGRSALAADTLQTLGYGNVSHLDGGIKAWKSAGKPVAEQG